MSEPTPQPPSIPGASTADPAPAPIAAPPADASPPADVSPPAPPAAAAPAPRRSFVDPASIRPTAIIAIVIAALFYGTQILNEALPAAASEVPVSAAGTVAIGDGPVITPIDGWVASPHDSREGIRLEKGIVVVDLFSETFGEDAADLAAAYRDEVLASDTTQFTATPIQAFTSSSGTPGARFRYQGVFTGVDVAIEGEVTVLFDDGLGVVADAWTRQGDLDEALGEIHDMLQSIEL
ncbi:MAG TPA: hypothetical protein VFI15_06170 [Candidatus Limnocylindrales bacterium]|nr:hypothetical protein [Candidatus Limnocylindrales bacterium]